MVMEEKFSLVKNGYYDKPDGQDFFNKMVATNTYAGVTGLAWSTIDVLMVSHTKGYLPTIGRFAYHLGPMMGMASTFTLTTYALTNLRGKDDRINYFLGGLAAGSIYGAWKRCYMSGIVMGMAFGLAGVIKKTSKIEDWEFFPDINHAFTGVNRLDWTLMHEPPKGWTTGKEE